MDKNTLTGLVLVGVVFSVFTIFMQPSKEELQAQEKAKKEQASRTDKKIQKKSVTARSIVSSTNKDEVRPVGETVKGELVRLENDKLIVDFSTKGGKVAAVYLKEFESYQDYSKRPETDRKNSKRKISKPLQLFAEGDAVNQLIIPLKRGKINTGNYIFSIDEKDAQSITFSITFEGNQTIKQRYVLPKSGYELAYAIEFDGVKVSDPKSIALNWKTAYRRTERLFSEQRRVSTVCYYNKESGIDYLSEMGDDYGDAEEKIDWVSFKQSYFSSFIRPSESFEQKGTKFAVQEFDEKDKKAWTHIKDFSFTGYLAGVNPSSDVVKFNWYFGPNDFEILKANGPNYDDVLNFGWGLFRWINIYAVQPLFNMFTSTGMNLGIAILLLTLVLKFVLMPIQWKMYTSSAKMRILKPEVDELNAKYPNKDDAMKKQMEMMTLYRESGASPLAGCVPMLIQMPILLAVFRFFPAAFELRQKPFLWAEDLSSYDSILDLGFNIWFYGDHISLFTLLMAGTTLLYTWMNSGNMQQPQQPGMPNMKVIMYIFPVMMIFFFNNYSSGLSYYYFISTLISILIMLLIKQFFVDEDKLKAKMAERKAAATTKVKKKSKFQERLEQMQKMQQEQLKQRKKK
jgi:YidC/Oxa1 family membrane protein insertase